MLAVVADALPAILQGESVARSLRKNIADCILRDRITNVHAHDHCLSAMVAWGCGERSADEERERRKMRRIYSEGKRLRRSR